MDAIYRSVFQHISVGAILVQRKDAQTFTILDVNPSAARAGGWKTYTPGAIIGKDVKDVFDGLLKSGLLDLCNKALNTGSDVDLDSFVYEDSEVPHGIFHVRLLPLSEDTLLITYDNVTEQKQTEAQLKRHEEQYRSVVTALSEGVALYDREANLLAHNASAERILGLTADQMAGRSLVDPQWDTIYEDHTPFPAEEYPAMVTLREGKALHNQIMGFSKPDGSLTWISINTEPLFLDGEDSPNAVVASFVDITERKEANAELEAKNEELEHFAYTISHDLRSPLFTIKGFIGLLENDIALGRKERLAVNIKQITNAADKMQLLLNKILELSRIGRLANPSEAINLVTLASEAVDLIRGNVDARGVVVDIDPALPTVVGDRIRLLQVFQNLLENAVKFMGDQETPMIEVGLRHDEGEAVIYVKDNGIGIAPHYQDKVFRLFERLNPHIEGSGFGLSLVSRIIDVHRGRIWIESEGEGKGSTFCFTLPRGR